MELSIISQGSMLSSGASNPAIPSTPSGAKAGGGTRSNGVGKVSSQMITVAGHPSGVRMPDVVVGAARKAHLSLSEAVKPRSVAAKPLLTKGGDSGPSTFLEKVLGGHLPTSWLVAGPRGR